MTSLCSLYSYLFLLPDGISTTTSMTAGNSSLRSVWAAAFLPFFAAFVAGTALPRLAEFRLPLVEVEQAIRRLRVVRRFSAQPVTAEDVHALLEAGRRT